MNVHPMQPRREQVQVVLAIGWGTKAPLMTHRRVLAETIKRLQGHCALKLLLTRATSATSATTTVIAVKTPHAETAKTATYATIDAPFAVLHGPFDGWLIGRTT